MLHFYYTVSFLKFQHFKNKFLSKLGSGFHARETVAAFAGLVTCASAILTINLDGLANIGALPTELHIMPDDMLGFEPRTTGLTGPFRNKHSLYKNI